LKAPAISALSSSVLVSSPSIGGVTNISGGDARNWVKKRR
jgi:hypothetical protein